MTRDEKDVIIDNLSKQIDSFSHLYLTDTSELNAADTSLLRRKCHEKEILLVVVKNTLLKRAMQKSGRDFEPIFNHLNGSTSVLFSNVGNVPGKLIQEFRKTHEKPILKAAFVEEGFYFGDAQLGTLVSVKSKDELIGDLIGLLQSPMKNLVSALQSGGNTIAGIVKTLSEKE